MVAISRFKLCWVSALAFLTAFHTGCVIQANRMPKSFEYVSLQPGRGFSLIFDVETLTITPTIKNSSFGIPPSGLEICDSESAYICFEAEFGNMTFSFPKNLKDIQSWEYEDRKFYIIRENLSTGCGSNYFVRAEKNKKPTQIFEFNYVNGLRTIYPISSVEIIKSEFSEDEIYKFGDIHVANGIGFGAAGNCSNL